MDIDGFKLYIDGQWISKDETFASYNPATGDIWAEIPNGTRDEEKGLAIANRLQTGMAHINDSSVNDEPHVPFGGMKSSGVGRHGGKASVEAFTELRWLTLERGGRHYPPPFMVAPQGG